MAVNKNKVVGADVLSQQLVDGCCELNIQLTEQQRQQLLAYLALFYKWNQAYNLSAVRDIDGMLSRHLLDSLSLIPEIKTIQNPQLTQRWVDVGTGGGLPGIPLAIVFPDTKMTLLDSNGKKTRFLFQVATELSLKNVDVVQSRVEAYQPDEKFQIVFSRAYATLRDMVESCHHLLTTDGRFYAMKGQQPRQELTALKASGVKTSVLVNTPLQAPNADGERHLIVIGFDVG